MNNLRYISVLCFLFHAGLCLVCTDINDSMTIFRLAAVDSLQLWNSGNLFRQV